MCGEGIEGGHGNDGSWIYRRCDGIRTAVLDCSYSR